MKRSLDTRDTVQEPERSSGSTFGKRRSFRPLLPATCKPEVTNSKPFKPPSFNAPILAKPGIPGASGICTPVVSAPTKSALSADLGEVANTNSKQAATLRAAATTATAGAVGVLNSTASIQQANRGKVKALATAAPHQGNIDPADGDMAPKSALPIAPEDATTGSLPVPTNTVTSMGVGPEDQSAINTGRGAGRRSGTSALLAKASLAFDQDPPAAPRAPRLLTRATAPVATSTTSAEVKMQYPAPPVQKTSALTTKRQFQMPRSPGLGTPTASASTAANQFGVILNSTSSSVPSTAPALKIAPAAATSPVFKPEISTNRPKLTLPSIKPRLAATSSAARAGNSNARARILPSSGCLPQSTDPLVSAATTTQLASACVPSEAEDAKFSQPPAAGKATSRVPRAALGAAKTLKIMPVAKPVMTKQAVSIKQLLIIPSAPATTSAPATSSAPAPAAPAATSCHASRPVPDGTTQIPQQSHKSKKCPPVQDPPATVHAVGSQQSPSAGDFANQGAAATRPRAVSPSEDQEYQSKDATEDAACTGQMVQLTSPCNQWSFLDRDSSGISPDPKPQESKTLTMRVAAEEVMATHKIAAPAPTSEEAAEVAQAPASLPSSSDQLAPSMTQGATLPTASATTVPLDLSMSLELPVVPDELDCDEASQRPIDDGKASELAPLLSSIGSISLSTEQQQLAAQMTFGRSGYGKAVRSMIMPKPASAKVSAAPQLGARGINTSLASALTAPAAVTTVLKLAYGNPPWRPTLRQLDNENHVLRDMDAAMSSATPSQQPVPSQPKPQPQPRSMEQVAQIAAVSIPAMPNDAAIEPDYDSGAGLGDHFHGYGPCSRAVAGEGLMPVDASTGCGTAMHPTMNSQDQEFLDILSEESRQVAEIMKDFSSFSILGGLLDLDSLHSLCQ